MSYTPNSIVASIGALMAATIANLPATPAWCLGFAGPGDGGEGQFVVGENATADGITIFNDASGRSWYRQFAGKVNAKWAGVKANFVTDDSAAFGKAVAYCVANHKALYVPSGGGIIIANASLIPQLQYVTIKGDNVDAYGLTASSTGNVGSTFFITDTVNPVFNLGVGVRMSGLNFFWPGQTEQTCTANGGVPIAYPPLFNIPMGGTGRCVFENIQVVNAYDIFVEAIGSGGLSDVVIDKCRMFAVHDYFRGNNSAEVIQATNCLFSLEPFDYGLFPSGATTHNLLSWHANNSSWFHAVGEGASDNTGNSFGIFATNCYLYGMKHGVYADTGCAWVGLTNVGMDGVQLGWRCDPGGKIITSYHRGGNLFQYNSWEQIAGARSMLTMNPTSAPATTITTPFALADDVTRGFELEITGLSNEQSDGSLFNVSGSGVQRFSINGGTYRADYSTITMGQTANCPNGQVKFQNASTIQNVPGYTGIAVGQNSGQVVIQNNLFAYPENSINLTSASGSYVTISGNRSFGTQGTDSILNPNVNYLGVNMWDVRPDQLMGAGGYVAAGTTQTTATGITTLTSLITSGSGGIILPSVMKGISAMISNRLATAIDIYPALGGQIDSMGANIPFSLAAGATAQFATTNTDYWLITLAGVS